MIYLDDNVTHHPKLVKAGTTLGNGGRAYALALFIEGLGYARRYLTDGFVPDEIVNTSAVVPDPPTVAAALVQAKLWHRVTRGFSIHDYGEWNEKKRDVLRDRKLARDRKRRQRARDNGHEPSDITRDNSPTYRESRPLSRCDIVSRRDRGVTLARARVPQPQPQPRTCHDREIRKPCTPCVLTGAKNRAPVFSRERKNHDAQIRIVSRVVCDGSRRDRTRADDQRRRMGRTHQGSTRATRIRVPDAGSINRCDSRGRVRDVETMGRTHPANAAARTETTRPVAAHTRRGDRGVAVVARSRIDHNNQTDPARPAANDARRPRDRAATRVAARVRGDHRAIHPMRRGRIERAA